MTAYDPARWFWSVAGDATKISPSAAQGYVSPDDTGYTAFLAEGNAPTRIASEDALRAVLAPYSRALLAGEAAPLSIAARVALLESDGAAVKAALVKKAVVSEAEIAAEKPAVLATLVSRA